MSRWIALAALVTAATLTVPAFAAAAAPVGTWRFDEGSGTVARDSGPFHLDGVLSATGSPTWIHGVAGNALHFDGDGVVELPDSPALEPTSITVAAWVRRVGSPGAYRYVFSKGSSSCMRSAYGLYTAEQGGAAFYVAGDGIYAVSPQIPAASVWDGRWHRIAGSYDGRRVRFYLDGLRVGQGTPAPTHVEYGLASRAAYIGTYRGDCELAFAGDIDGVSVWDSALTTAEIAADATPPPETPTTGPIGPAPGAPRPGSPGLPVPEGYSVTPPRCTSVKVSKRSVRVARRTRIVATVRRGTKPLRGARVVMRGHRLRKVARTNALGRARFIVRASRTHRRLNVRVVTAKRAACGTPVAYITVRRPAS
jgi:hypothetical protein